MSNVVEPGWYTDPENPLLRRWWDGSEWAHDEQPRRTLAIIPAAPEATAPRQGQPGAVSLRPAPPGPNPVLRAVVLLVILITLIAFGIGGYFAARTTSRTVAKSSAPVDELNFRNDITPSITQFRQVSSTFVTDCGSGQVTAACPTAIPQLAGAVANFRTAVNKAPIPGISRDQDSIRALKVGLGRLAIAIHELQTALRTHDTAKLDAVSQDAVAASFIVAGAYTTAPKLYPAPYPAIATQ